MWAMPTSNPKFNENYFIFSFNKIETEPLVSSFIIPTRPQKTAPKTKYRCNTIQLTCSNKLSNVRVLTKCNTYQNSQVYATIAPPIWAESETKSIPSMATNTNKTNDAVYNKEPNMQMVPTRENNTPITNDEPYTTMIPPRETHTPHKCMVGQNTQIPNTGMTDQNNQQTNTDMVGQNNQKPSMAGQNNQIPNTGMTEKNSQKTKTCMVSQNNQESTGKTINTTEPETTTVPPPRTTSMINTITEPSTISVPAAETSLSTHPFIDSNTKTNPSPETTSPILTLYDSNTHTNPPPETLTPKSNLDALLRAIQKAELEEWETLPNTNHTGRVIQEEELQVLWTKHLQNFEKPKSEIFIGLKPSSKETIINLSPHQLSEAEKSLLNKGLSFALSNSNNNLTSLEKDRIANTKRISIRHMFPNSTGITKTGFYLKSNRPMRTPGILQPYAAAINNVAKQTQNNWSTNLSEQEQQALHMLRNNTDIVIKPADKGSSVVLLSRTAYEHSCLSQLHNNNYYKKLEQPRAPGNAKAIRRILDNMYKQGQLETNTYRALLPEAEPRPRLFYGLPKIHKPKHKWLSTDCPPVRPIISDTGSESHMVAKLIAHHLREPATRHPAYIKDTWHFLSKIRRLQLPPKTILVTMDVESLYTNIPLKEGLHLCEQALNKRDLAEKKVKTSNLMRLLEIQAYNNDFQFGEETFLQIHGTAMGKSWAPALADLFMANWEETLFQHCQTHNIPHPNFFWVRYLDDVFMIWTHSKQDLENFLNVANNWHDNITLEATWNDTQIDFLDVTIYKGENHSTSGLLDTKSYRKPTDKMQYLHPLSCHPEHTFRGLIHGLLLRLQRLNSQLATFIVAAKELFQALLHRGYNRRTLHRRFKTFFNNMVHLGTWNAETSTKTPPTRIPLVLPYNKKTAKCMPKLKRIQRDFINSLRTETQRNSIRKLLGGPPLPAYRRNKLIRNFLVHSKHETNVGNNALQH